MCNHGKVKNFDELVWKAGRWKWNLEHRALVMAILNITPDSFSDGGKHFSEAATLAAAGRFVAEGADIIDLGGESTRPGAVSVSVEEEKRRVLPILKTLIAKRARVAISVDTNKPEIAHAALQAGAEIVNDVTGFRDPEMIEVCRNSSCGLVVMHMKGNPQTMQKAPSYRDLMVEIRAFFEERLDTLTRAGIDPSRIVFDPGIGFGKTLEHNLALIEHLDAYKIAGRPILMGLSRKSFIGQLLGDPAIECREMPTLALTAFARQKGALIHRVHLVKENLDVLRMTEALMPVS